MPRLSKQHQRLPAFDLKAEREKRDMTQAECAVFFFTTQATIARWESSGDTPQIHREYWALYWKHQKPTKVKENGKKAA